MILLFYAICIWVLGVTRLMASCRTSTRGLGKLWVWYPWLDLDHFAQPCMRWYAYDVYAFTMTIVFQCLYYSEICVISFNYLWVIDQYIVIYLVTFPVARWEPMDVMFYHLMFFSYSWRTDAIMMIIFISLSCLCRIEMMLPWFCDWVISCLG